MDKIHSLQWTISLRLICQPWWPSPGGPLTYWSLLQRHPPIWKEWPWPCGCNRTNTSLSEAASLGETPAAELVVLEVRPKIHFPSEKIESWRIKKEKTKPNQKHRPLSRCRRCEDLWVRIPTQVPWLWVRGSLTPHATTKVFQCHQNRKLNNYQHRWHLSLPTVTRCIR